MIEIYKRTVKDEDLIKISEIEKGSWVSAVDPTESEVALISKKLGLEEDILKDGLDENELPYIIREENIVYAIIRVPYNNTIGVTTIPLLIAITNENVLTLCKKRDEVTEAFLQKKHFYTTQKTQFLLKTLLENVYKYETYLKRISKDVKSKKIKLEKLGNKDILNLVHFEETLNDFESSFSPILNILQRIVTGKYVSLYERDKDIIDDLVIDSKETLELTEVTLKTISNIREAYSTILSNNLNRIIKFFTAATILLTIPTVVSSIYGMNINLPLSDSPLAFTYIISITLAICALLLILFMKKRWM